MSFINIIKKDKYITKEELRVFLILLNPLAPHITSEIYERVFGGNIIDDTWPKYDETKLSEDNVTLAVQVNGKLRGTIDAAKDASNEEVEELAKANENVKKFIDGMNIVKIIVVPNKIVNIVVK